MSTNPYVTFSFPFRFEFGKVSKTGGEASVVPSFPEIESSVNCGVRQLILTEPTERVMLGTFGVGASKYVFSPLGSSIRDLLSFEVEDQLGIWEQRVNLVDLNTEVFSSQGTMLMNLVLNLTEFERATALSVSIGF
jgi:phage baseplate assembly protein W